MGQCTYNVAWNCQRFGSGFSGFPMRSFFSSGTQVFFSMCFHDRKTSVYVESNSLPSRVEVELQILHRLKAAGHLDLQCLGGVSLAVPCNGTQQQRGNLLLNRFGSGVEIKTPNCLELTSHWPWRL